MMMPTERSLAKCGAIDSCLWELLALENHLCPRIAKLNTTTFSSKFAKPQFDLDAILEAQPWSFYSDLMEFELNHLWTKRPAIQTHLQETLF